MTEELIYEENTKKIGRREGIQNLFYSIIFFAISVSAVIVSLDISPKKIDSTYVLLGVSIGTLVLGILFLYVSLIGFGYTNMRLYDDKIILPVTKGILKKQEDFILFSDIKEISLTNKNRAVPYLLISLKNGRNEIIPKYEIENIDKVMKLINQGITS